MHIKSTTIINKQAFADTVSAEQLEFIDRAAKELHEEIFTNNCAVIVRDFYMRQMEDNEKGWDFLSRRELTDGLILRHGFLLYRDRKFRLAQTAQVEDYWVSNVQYIDISHHKIRRFCNKRNNISRKRAEEQMRLWRLMKESEALGFPVNFDPKIVLFIDETPTDEAIHYADVLSEYNMYPVDPTNEETDGRKRQLLDEQELIKKAQLESDCHGREIKEDDGLHIVIHKNYKKIDKEMDFPSIDIPDKDYVRVLNTPSEVNEQAMQDCLMDETVWGKDNCHGAKDLSVILGDKLNTDVSQKQVADVCRELWKLGILDGYRYRESRTTFDGEFFPVYRYYRLASKLAPEDKTKRLQLFELRDELNNTVDKNTFFEVVGKACDMLNCKKLAQQCKWDLDHIHEAIKNNVIRRKDVVAMNEFKAFIDLARNVGRARGYNGYGDGPVNAQVDRERRLKHYLSMVAEQWMDAGMGSHMPQHLFLDMFNREYGYDFTANEFGRFLKPLDFVHRTRTKDEMVIILPAVNKD